jgi:serine/threonine protein kinase
MPLSAGDKLGPYEILAPIGAGGMGQVYRARPHNPKAGSDSIPIEHGPAQFNAFYPQCSGSGFRPSPEGLSRRSTADRILDDELSRFAAV